VQTFAIKPKFEIATRQRLFRALLSIRLPVTAVPEHDRASAILALWYRPFEIAVIERMVFHLDGEALVTRIQGGASSYRPRFEDAVQFKAQVIMQPRGVMLLDSRVKAKSRFAS
jgi:hypothetical protein